MWLYRKKYLTMLKSARVVQHGQVFLPVEPHLDVLLDHDAASLQFVRPQLLHVGHMASTEEQFVFTKLVFVRVRDESGHDVLAGGPMVPFLNIFGMTQYPVSHVEV